MGIGKNKLVVTLRLQDFVDTSVTSAKFVPLPAGKGPNDAVRPGFYQLDGPDGCPILFGEMQRNLLLEPLRPRSEFTPLGDT